MYDSDNSYYSDDDDDDDDDDELDDEILQSIARSFRKKYERKPTEKGAMLAYLHFLYLCWKKDLLKNLFNNNDFIIINKMISPRHSSNIGKY